MNAAAVGQQPEGPSETLQNIVRMTRDKDSMFKTYYTDENGELVTVSMFNVEDPASLIGRDVYEVSWSSFRYSTTSAFTFTVFNRLLKIVAKNQTWITALLTMRTW